MPAKDLVRVPMMKDDKLLAWRLEWALASVEPTSQERQQVEAAYAAWDAAFAPDAKRIAAFYIEDAIFLPATHEVIGVPQVSSGSSTACSPMGSPATGSSWS